jgi:hypothetical protein
MAATLIAVGTALANAGKIAVAVSAGIAFIEALQKGGTTLLTPAHLAQLKAISPVVHAAVVNDGDPLAGNPNYQN